MNFASFADSKSDLKNEDTAGLRFQFIEGLASRYTATKCTQSLYLSLFVELIETLHLKLPAT